MRLKGQHTTKTEPKDALGLYIDQRRIALCVVRDSAVDSAEGKHVLLLTHVGHRHNKCDRRLIFAGQILGVPLHLSNGCAKHFFGWVDGGRQEHGRAAAC